MHATLPPGGVRGEHKGVGVRKNVMQLESGSKGCQKGFKGETKAESKVSLMCRLCEKKRKKKMEKRQGH